MNTNSEKMIVKTIHLALRLNRAIGESVMAGTLRCKTVQVQAKIVVKQSIRMVRVPLLLELFTHPTITCFWSAGLGVDVGGGSAVS